MIPRKSPRGDRGRCSTAGFTVIELLVVLFVIAVLIALVVAGVMRAREAARRLQCVQNLHQIGLGLQSYLSSFGVFPPGYQAGLGSSFLVAILPYVEQKPLYDMLENGGLTTAQQVSIGLYHCPSDGSTSHLQSTGTTSYAGNQGTGVQAYGYNGAFAYTDVIGPGQITDGTGTTAAVSEWLVGPFNVMTRDPVRSVFHTPKRWDQPGELELFASTCHNLDPLTAELTPMTVGMIWTHGDFGHTLYNHIMTIGENTCQNGAGVQTGAWTAKSNHSGGVNVLFADGDVRFIPATINPKVWTAIGTRAGGEVVSGQY